MTPHIGSCTSCDEDKHSEISKYCYVKGRIFWIVKSDTFSARSTVYLYYNQTYGEQFFTCELWENEE